MNPKILLVDDNPGALAALSRNLHGLFDIETATSAEDGALKFEDLGPFDVVVSDLKMPGRDGIQFLKAIRRNDSSVPCIILSGAPDTTAAINAINEIGVFRFLTKPVCIDELTRVLDAATMDHRARLVRTARM